MEWDGGRKWWENGTWAADTMTRSRERRFQGPEVTDHKETKVGNIKSYIPSLSPSPGPWPLSSHSARFGSLHVPFRYPHLTSGTRGGSEAWATDTSVARWEVRVRNVRNGRRLERLGSCLSHSVGSRLVCALFVPHGSSHPLPSIPSGRGTKWGAEGRGDEQSDE